MCGHDLERSSNPDMDGWYKVEETEVCYACAALERWREENEVLEPGLVPFVVDTRPESKPLRPRGRPSSKPS